MKVLDNGDIEKKACKVDSMKGGERIHHSAASLQREYRV